MRADILEELLIEKVAQLRDAERTINSQLETINALRAELRGAQEKYDALHQRAVELERELLGINNVRLLYAPNRELM